MFLIVTRRVSLVDERETKAFPRPFENFVLGFLLSRTLAYAWFIWSESNQVKHFLLLKPR